MITVFKHVWVLGHSMQVNRGMTRAMNDSSSRGWLYTCECGVKVAR